MSEEVREGGAAEAMRGNLSEATFQTSAQVIFPREVTMLDVGGPHIMSFRITERSSPEQQKNYVDICNCRLVIP